MYNIFHVYCDMLKRGISWQFTVMTHPGVWAALILLFVAQQCDLKRGPDDPRYPDLYKQTEVRNAP